MRKAAAQIPEGLDLDKWINDEPEVFTLVFLLIPLGRSRRSQSRLGQSV